MTTHTQLQLPFGEQPTIKTRWSASAMTSEDILHPDPDAAAYSWWRNHEIVDTEEERTE